MSSPSTQEMTAALARYLGALAMDQAPRSDLDQHLLAVQTMAENLTTIVLQELPSSQQMELLQALDAADLITVLEAMAPQERQQVLNNLPDAVTTQLMDNLSQEFQRTLCWLFDRPIAVTTATQVVPESQYPDWWEIDDCGD